MYIIKNSCMATLPNFKIVLKLFSGSMQLIRYFEMRCCEKPNVSQLQNLNSKILHKELVVISIKCKIYNQIFLIIHNILLK